MAHETLPLDQMKLPSCSIPRPGDRVVSYQGALRVRGRLIGHRPKGQPYITNEFGGPSNWPSFEYIWLENPLHPLGPNWERVPPGGQILRPNADEVQAFQQLLGQAPRAGPPCLELVGAIWARGFEVFVVGEAVRDAVERVPARRVEMVTTMPLTMVEPLLVEMYGQDFHGMSESVLMDGRIPLTTILDSDGPVVSLSVFRYALPGTADAVFGAAFGPDVWHRDYAFDSVYYDPVNRALIDPTGRGVSEAENRVLSLVTHPALLEGAYGQTVIFTFFGHLCLGFTAAESCILAIGKHIEPTLRPMKPSARVSHVQSLVLGRFPKPERGDALGLLQSQFTELGFGHIWTEYLEPLRGDLLS